MPHPIDPSTLRILKPTGQTVGTGFLVAKNLIVTCAHVIKIIKANPGDTVDIRFTGEVTSVSARVLSEYWRSDEATDIAILQVDEVPTEVFPLRMGRASESKLKNDLYTFGYAIAADEQGIGGLGTFITLKQEGNFIQFRMHEANHGHSGAPIYDDKRGVVVGMIKKGHTGTGRNAETTFAIPTETIWQVCPQLKPPTPVLPRRNPIVEGINLLPYDYDQRIQHFLGEYLGSEANPVPFGGRDDAMKMLNDWLNVSAPYLLLAAPAGRGKSALLVRWLDSLKAREDLALVFIPVSIRFGTNKERVFYAAMAARLAFLHGADVLAAPKNHADEIDEYKGRISRFLSKPLPNGRTLLVVLDGLDEAADWRIKADFLPAELPNGVRVVVSARFLARDVDNTSWLHRLNWERSRMVFAPALDPLDQIGVADVLLKMGSPFDELSRNVNIIAKLHYLTRGDPLLLSLYVGDLWGKDEEVTHLKPEDLENIQPGYKGYFERWWDDQKELWGKEKPWLEQHVRAVRSLLAGAMSPLFMDDMQALDSKLGSDDIVDALDILKRFIIGNNQSLGYTFSHPKLAQYFWEVLTETEQAQWEKRFLVWGEQVLQEFIDGTRSATKKKEVPFYVVSNYIAHLGRAEQPIEKYLPLIHYKQWAQAWFTVEGAYRGYLQDVQRVWERCMVLDRQAIETNRDPAYLGIKIRCSLIAASLHSLMENIPSELISVFVQTGLWTFPQAWMVIRQIASSDQQADAILKLLPYLDDRQLPEALTTARTIQNDRYRVSVLSDLVLRLPEVADEAFAIVEIVQDEWDRSLVLSDLAQHLPESELKRVLKAAENIDHEWDRAWVLSDLAQRMPKRELEKILKAALAIKDERARATILSNLAQRSPKRMLCQVLEAARAIQDPQYRAIVLGALAQHLPEVSDEALAVAQMIQDKSSRADVLAKLVQQLPIEDLWKVFEATRTINPDGICNYILRNLVKRLPEMSGEVLIVARGFQDASLRAELLSVLARYLPEIAEEALVAAKTIKYEEFRATLLSNLAQHLPARMLGQVLEAARAIQDEGARARLLSDLAQRLPKLAEEALATARAVRSNGPRTQALSRLAQWLPEVANEALSAAQAVQDEGSRARMLSALAQYLPEALGEALTAARDIHDEGTLTLVLNDLVQRLPENELGKVLEIVRTIENAQYRAIVLGDLAQRLPEAAGEAVIAAQTIQDEGVLVHVLSNLVKKLPTRELEQIVETARALQHEWLRASTLSTLAQRLPEMADEALSAVRAIRDEGSRASLLSAFIQHIPEIASETLAAIRAIQDDEILTSVLRDLAQELPEDGLEQVLGAALVMVDQGHRAIVLSDLASRMPEDKLDQVLTEARAIQEEWPRARVLSALAQRLPEVANEALTVARSIQREIPRARVLSDLVQCLPELLDEALTAVWSVQNEGDRASMLRDLAQPMTKIPHKKRLLLMDASLAELSHRTRANLYSDLAALMSVILTIGTDDTPREIYEAVRDVTTWWP